MERLNLDSTFERLEKLAKNDGAEVELLIEKSDKFSVSFQKGKPDKFDSSTSHCAGLRVIKDGYPGYSYSENLSEAALAQAYNDALSNAAFAAQDADPGKRIRLAEFSETVAEMPELFNESLSQVPIEQKLERARTLEAAALAVDSRVSVVPYSGYTEVDSEYLIYNSRGVRRKQRQVAVVGHVYPLAKEGDESRMAGEGAFTRNALKFNPEEIAIKAAQKSVAKLGSVSPSTGRYPIVIDSEVAAEVFGLISDYFSAKSVSEKNSIFADDLGKAIASSKLTITDDPFFLNGTAARAFDSEGAPSRRTPLIKDGKLVNFLTNSVYAERMKLPHTASAARSARSELDVGISNMLITPGTKPLSELLNAYPKLIYITDFTGYHAGFNSGSGDFSLQAEGELWENGKRVSPLANFVVSGNIKELLKGIEEVGSRVAPPTGSVISPDILIRELSVAGK